MPTASLLDSASSAVPSEERRSLDLIDRWFRELDHRRIHYGAREWLVEVTGILCEEDVLWIQIAARARSAGSVLLCVRESTSVEQAVKALSIRTPGLLSPTVSYPDVIDTVG
jgi:hypothetical protein